MNGPPCGVCGFTLRWLPQQNGWGCDRCQRMFPASGPGAPQQAATPPPGQPSPWAPPGQPAFAPPQQQGFKPPQQQGFAPQHPPQQQAPQQQPPQQHNPYAPPAQPGYGQQPPNPYAPPGATPHGAYPAHGQPQHPPHGQQQPYSPHAPTPPPAGAVAAPGKKSGKGLIIGLAVAGVAIAGGIIAFVMMRGGGAPKGGDSRDAVIKGTLSAMAAGNVEQMLDLADPVGLHNKLVDCSGKTKPRKKEGREDDEDEDDDDDKDLSDEEKERRDPKKQREKMKEELEKIVPKTKGAKIELVEIITKEPPVPSDDEKKKKDDDEDYDPDKEMTFLMKSGERIYKGCYTKAPARLAETKIKIKVTPPKEEKSSEQEVKVMLVQVGKGWYLTTPPRISVGGAALAKEFSEMRDKVCACKDYACAEKLKDDFKSDRGKEFKKEMKELSDKEKDKIDAIEEEIKVCEKKLAGEGQLTAMTQFKDKVCACNDKACADKVMQEMSVWSRSQDNDKMPDDIMKKAATIGEEMSKCISKLYSAGTGGGIGSTIAEAGSVSTDGMPAACLEYKNFIGKLATCSKFPESSRKSLEEGFRAMEDGWKAVDWKSMPADSKKQVNDGCQQGLDAMKQSATAMGC